jgi:dTDP-4-amino-4,6-dideoxygalactose transaminase
MRTTFLPFALPDIDEAELVEIKDALNSGWITTGPKVRQFEADFATYVGAKHAIAVNSCTAAMHLGLEAIGLQPGDLVLTTPYTFAATAEVIRYFDAIPIFVDIEPDTLNIDLASVAEAVSDLSRGGSAAQRWLPPTIQNPKAILPVHIAGYPCDLAPIYAIAAEHGLAVIEVY